MLENLFTKKKRIDIGYYGTDGIIVLEVELSYKRREDYNIKVFEANVCDHQIKSKVQLVHKLDQFCFNHNIKWKFTGYEEFREYKF